MKLKALSAHLSSIGLQPAGLSDSCDQVCLRHTVLHCKFQGIKIKKEVYETAKIILLSFIYFKISFAFILVYKLISYT